jgi:glucosamine--fructose-6-phosphate aminotransferase (isomerizing)
MGRYVDCALVLVVIRNEHAERGGDDAPAHSGGVGEAEAPRADARRTHLDLDVLAEPDLRPEVDLQAREDHLLLPCAEAFAQEGDSRLLEVGGVDGIVDVPERVEIPKAHVLAMDERHARDAIDGVMAGEQTRTALFAQPQWLRAVPTDTRLPDGARVVHTGCGTSFHAAQTGGIAVQALDAVGAPPEADILVVVSHEGDTPITLEAARAFRGERWLVTGKPDSALGELCERVIVATPEVERSWCHTASYTCAVAAIAALHGDDVSSFPGAVEQALEEAPRVTAHERWLVAGAGDDWPTAQEAVLKLREGAFVAAEAHHTEQLLHGQLAAVDDNVRCFVLAGEGRAKQRATDALAALRELGCDAELLPTVHPAVDIVPFQLLTLALADARGVDPDRIRRDDPRWARARATYR